MDRRATRDSDGGKTTTPVRELPTEDHESFVSLVGAIGIGDSVPGATVPWLLRLPYPVRNLLRRWRGMLGMVIGVGIALSIGMTLLAVLQADLNLLTGDYRSSGANLYVTAEGGKLIALLPGDTPGTIKHARHTLAQIRGLPGVRAVLGVMSWTMERRREGPRRPHAPVELLAVMGVAGDPTLIPNALVLKAGRWLRNSREAVIGTKVSSDKALQIGDSLNLDGENVTIVGIGKLRGFGLTADSLVYVDDRALQQRAEIGDVLNVIAVETDRPAQTRQQIADLGSLTAYTPDDLIRQADEANAAGVAFYWVMIVLTLAIGALFVSSMLSHSVSERRLEFATLRAIGVPTHSILLTVAAEALFIGVAASGVGVCLSLFFGVLLNALVAPTYGLASLYVADPGLFVIVFALALGLGLISGFFPARAATRVDPIEVLREV